VTPLAEKILEYVEIHPGASFVEITKIEGCEGELALTFSTYENIVLWPSMSQACVEALAELRNAKLIEMKPSTPLVYMIDGGLVKLPLAKTARQYKEPHWLPTVLWPTRKKSSRLTKFIVDQKIKDATKK